MNAIAVLVLLIGIALHVDRARPPSDRSQSLEAAAHHVCADHELTSRDVVLCEDFEDHATLQQWDIGSNGGTWPKWSNDELFYWEGNNLMAVSFTADGSAFRPAAPRRLFTGAQAGMGAENTMSSYNPEYDVSADGTRFVVTQRP